MEQVGCNICLSPPGNAAHQGDQKLVLIVPSLTNPFPPCLVEATGGLLLVVYQWCTLHSYYKA